jgi:hypothetical protein
MTAMIIVFSRVRVPPFKIMWGVCVLVSFSMPHPVISVHMMCAEAKKVWHNYGFDRHVLFNEGLNCRGFAGDTMHMARLWDSSRDKADA